MANTKRVILDLDVGSDDALALVIFLKADEDQLVKIDAICCTMGNTVVDNVCRNVLRLLEIAGRTDIPVYRGAAEAIIKTNRKCHYFHGVDGFGDLEYEKEPELGLIKDVPSAIAMYEIAKKFKNNVYLICLGPLTNVALSMKLYAEFSDYLNGIYIMGGNYKAIGNVTKTAEYNFYVDPESAHIVLNQAKCPITILPWETCIAPKITFNWRFNILGNTDNPVIELLNRVEGSIYKSTKGYWMPCDAFLAAAFIYPECIHWSENHHATVELHGHETRGQLVLDHLKNEEENVRIVKRINEDMFKNILLKTVGHKI